MPNDALRAIAQTLPNAADDPDAALFRALRALVEADDAHGRASRLTDEILAEGEGREVTAADEAALTAASAAYEAALDAVLGIEPRTLAGLRALLRALAV